jgi:hypothetical protein
MAGKKAGTHKNGVYRPDNLPEIPHPVSMSEEISS